MRRILLAVTALALLAVASPASAASYKLGISDQSAAVFTHPLFKPLKLRIARYVTPWDVMADYAVADRNNLINWTNHARANGQRIMIAFEASHSPGHQTEVPSKAKYTAMLRKFKAAYPYVRDIQPWNEVNRCQYRTETGYYAGQPICKKPKKAAEYYMAALKVFKGPRYKVSGLDILDGANIDCSAMYCALRYIRTFLKYAKPHPKFWGFHNYSDTNRFSTMRTRAMLRATKRGDVWITETGGIVSLGKNFPFSTSRAAKALGCMFTVAKVSRRITRMYVYHFFGLPKGKSFDAGLLNSQGGKRPGYDVVKKRRARPCKR